ncbi:MAG: VOC family protein [Actinomycetota bacterium]
MSLVPADRPVIMALPTADRRASFDFYTALGLRVFGEPAGDDIPEPLQFDVNAGLRLMFVPPGGFGWVTNNRPTATGDQTECLLGLPVASPEDVDKLIGTARQAGGKIVMEPAQQPWGYSAVFADPDDHLWQVNAG